MRSSEELLFRARQELGNVCLWLAPSSLPAQQPSPLPSLPHPGPVVRSLQGTPFSVEVERLAKLIMQGYVPMAGGAIQTGGVIQWRRDYRNHLESGTAYFRLVPYLDFRKVGDHKVIWDLNRHQHLVVLAQAFLFTGEPGYLEAIQAHLDTWVAQNPFMRGMNWTSALEVAFRALSWIWVYHLVGTHLRDDVRRRLLTGLDRHGRYLERNLSIYFAPNTHLLGEAVTLHALGVLFPSFSRADRWRAVGAEMTSLQLARQVRDDGSHFEQSAYYHVYALDFFLLHARLSPVAEDFSRKLRKMADYLHAVMGPARTLPLIGDDDGGRVFHPYGRCDRFGRATLATCSILFNETKWAGEADALAEQAAWWLGERALDGASSLAGSQPASTLFPDSGMAVMNSGSTHVLVDAGPFGGARGGHSHSDTLSLVVCDGPEETLVDSGTYTYISDSKLRDWFRGSSAHNTVRIDGKDQAIPVLPFRWLDPPEVQVLAWASGPDHDLVDAVCVQSANHATHRRRVLLHRQTGAEPDLLIILDRIDGTPGSHLIEQFWHPGEAFETVGSDRIRIGTRSYLVFPSGTEFHTVSQWRSRGFGEKTPSAAVVVRRESELPVTMWAALRIGHDGMNLWWSDVDEERATVHLENGVTLGLTVGHDGTFHLKSTLERNSTGWRPSPARDR